MTPYPPTLTTDSIACSAILTGLFLSFFGEHYGVDISLFGGILLVVGKSLAMLFDDAEKEQKEPPK